MTSETEDKTTANWMKEAQKGYIRMGVLILTQQKTQPRLRNHERNQQPHQRLLATHSRRRLPHPARPRKIRIHQRTLGNTEKPKTKSLQNHRIRRTNPKTRHLKANGNLQQHRRSFPRILSRRPQTSKPPIVLCLLCLLLFRLSSRKKLTLTKASHS